MYMQFMFRNDKVEVVKQTSKIDGTKFIVDRFVDTKEGRKFVASCDTYTDAMIIANYWSK